MPTEYTARTPLPQCLLRLSVSTIVVFSMLFTQRPECARLALGSSRRSRVGRTIEISALADGRMTKVLIFSREPGTRRTARRLRGSRRPHDEHDGAPEAAAF